jgi:glycosyltransferase involved in cell wall biosynthesis
MNFQEFKNQFQKVPVVEHPYQCSSKPTVSVCVQTYQHTKFIHHCLDGILMQQTDFDFEVLLGEDASADGTREICIEYAKRFPNKIRLFLHHRENNIKINDKPSGRFNLMYNLYSAQGKYIAFCEGDDYWIDPLKLQKQVDFLEKDSSYVMMFHNVQYTRDDQIFKVSTLLNKKLDGSQFTLKELALGHIKIPTPSVVIRNQIEDDVFDFLLDKPVADYPLWLRIAEHGNIFFDPTAMAVYRSHEGGLWSTQSKVTKWLTTIATLKLSHGDFKLEIQELFRLQILNLYNLAIHKSVEDFDVFKQVLQEFYNYDREKFFEFLKTDLYLLDKLKKQSNENESSPGYFKKIKNKLRKLIPSFLSMSGPLSFYF